MKPTFIHCFASFALLLFCFPLSAQRPGEFRPLIEHMRTINKGWDGQPVTPTLMSGQRFSSDIERIQQHLLLVEATLRQQTPGLSLSKKQLNNRLELLDVLHEYAQAGSFPINNHHSVRIPYFIDDFGTACAVGHLIIRSGHEDLAMSIHDRFNFNYLRDIPEPAVLAWASEQGFEFHELEWIQPAYEPAPNLKAVGTGTNGPVTSLYFDPLSQKTYLGGTFSEADESPCASLASAETIHMVCLEKNLPGAVTDVVVHNGVTYAAGYYESGPWGFGLISNDGDEWVFENVTSAYSYSGKTLYLHNGKVFFSECMASDGNNCHVWYKDGENDWVMAVETNGPVNAMSSTPEGITFAGRFDQAVITGTPFSVSNIVGLAYDNSPILYPEGINNEVFSLLQVGNYLYVGGRCLDDDTNGTFCLSRYENEEFHQVLSSNDLLSADAGSAIHDMELYNDNLYLAGEFVATNGWNYGSGLASFDPLFGYLTPVANFNGPVYAIERAGAGLYIAGEFNGGVHPDIHNIAYLPDSSTGIGLISRHGNLELYPNPAVDRVTVKSAHPLRSLKVLDMSGRTVLNEDLTSTAAAELSLETLGAGPYLVQGVDVNGSTSTTRVVKK